MPQIFQHIATQEHTIHVYRNQPWDDLTGTELNEDAMAVYRNCKLQQEKDKLDSLIALATSTQIGKIPPEELLRILSGAELSYHFYDEAREAMAVLTQAARNANHRIDIMPLIKKLIKHSGKAQMAMIQNDVTIHRYSRCIREHLAFTGYATPDYMGLSEIIMAGPTIPLQIRKGAHVMVEVLNQDGEARPVTSIANIVAGDRHLVKVRITDDGHTSDSFFIAPGQFIGKHLSNTPI